MWTGTSGTLVRLARTQDQAGGCAEGVTFASFAQMVLPEQGGVLLLANMAGIGVTAANNQGLWVIDASGQSNPIVRVGDVLTVDDQSKTIASISVFTSTTGADAQTRSFNKFGDVIYKVTFTDYTHRRREDIDDERHESSDHQRQSEAGEGVGAIWRITNQPEVAMRGDICGGLPSDTADNSRGS